MASTGSDVPVSLGLRVGSPRATGRAPMGPLAVALVCAWLLGSSMVRLITSDYFASETQWAISSDVIKAAPHVGILMGLGLFGATYQATSRELCRLVADPLMLFFLTTQGLAAVLGHEPIGSLAFVALLFIVFLTARLCVALLNDAEILRGLAFSSLVLVVLPMAVAVTCSGESGYDRRMAHYGFGDISLLGACLAFSWPRSSMKWLTLAVGIAGIVLMECRAVLLGLGTAVFVVWYLPSLRMLCYLAAGVPVLMIVLTVSPAARDLSVELMEKTLRLDDPSRGLGSGLTGRTELWEEGWSRWRDQPLLGTGPRTHVNPEVRRQTASVHNGYLVTLLEVGAPGMLAILLLFGRSAVWSVRRRNNTLLGRVLLTVSIAFVVRVFFTTMLFNAVTPLTLILVLWLEYVRPAPRLSPNGTLPVQGPGRT